MTTSATPPLSPEPVPAATSATPSLSPEPVPAATSATPSLSPEPVPAATSATPSLSPEPVPAATSATPSLSPEPVPAATSATPSLSPEPVPAATSATPSLSPEPVPAATSTAVPVPAASPEPVPAASPVPVSAATPAPPAAPAAAPAPVPAASPAPDLATSPVLVPPPVESRTGEPVTVGFDLDLTLLDTRPGIGATWAAFCAETGVEVDIDLVLNRLGPPLEHEMAHWVPEDRVTEMVARYRALYPTYAIEPSHPMPGARDAIRAVREAGGRAVVVTAKNGAHAELHLAHLGMEPDAVVGGLWAEGKAEALRAHGARVYVGDHVGDVRGAVEAGALSVAVATGPCPAEELRAAGADVVLTDLTDFRAWWSGYLA